MIMKIFPFDNQQAEFFYRGADEPAIYLSLPTELPWINPGISLDNFANKYLGLNEVDGDFYSGVNVTDDAASKIRPQQSQFRAGFHFFRGVGTTVISWYQTTYPRTPIKLLQVFEGTYLRTPEKYSTASMNSYVLFVLYLESTEVPL